MNRQAWTSELKISSLFSGCGGLDFGFSREGFRVLSAIDKDQDAVNCYNANHASVAQKSDASQVSGELISRDILVAGPPCQGFSTGGGYRDSDPRNDLLIQTCLIAAEHKPKLVIIENVSALTNRRNQSFLKAAFQILSEAGYYVDWSVLIASDYGVPQRRKRIVIVARSGSRPYRGVLPRPMETKSLGDVLADIGEDASNHRPKFPDKMSKHAIIARHIGPGQKLCNVRAGEASVATWDIPECFGEVSAMERRLLEAVRTIRRRRRVRSWGDADPVPPQYLFEQVKDASWIAVNRLIAAGYLRKVGDCLDLTNTFNGKYRRLSANEPSPTVDTRFGDIQLFLHPAEDRSLTVREAARIQGFPDDFTFPCSENAAFRLIGNAVPPPLSVALAQMCKELV